MKTVSRLATLSLVKGAGTAIGTAAVGLLLYRARAR